MIQRNSSVSWSQAGSGTISDENYTRYSHCDLFYLCHFILMGTLYLCDTGFKRMSQIPFLKKFLAILFISMEVGM